jgi:AAA+ ATPase superfamily predicted ATPase
MTSFVGRSWELDEFSKIMAEPEASVITIYGRRRVGKTTLIEKFFSDHGMIKCEGIEGGNDAAQRVSMLEQYGEQTNNSLLQKVTTKSWRELFRLINEDLCTGRVTLYLEEFQWLSNYKVDLIAEIKFFWDNYWKKNSDFTLILCGSSPSFMTAKVVHSKAMYNRSLHEFPIAPFSATETMAFLGPKRKKTEALQALLLVGGIPEYLKYLKKESSLYLALAKIALPQTDFLRVNLSAYLSVA